MVLSSSKTRTGTASIVLVLTLFLLSLSLVSAIDEYPQTGINPGGTFRSGTGNINGDNVINIVGSATISSPRDFSIPKVADLDQDGVNEIIVLDGNTIEVYQNSSLVAIDTVMLTRPLSDFQIANFSNDDNLSIIIWDNTSVYDIGFNGSDLDAVSVFDTGSVTCGSCTAKDVDFDLNTLKCDIDDLSGNKFCVSSRTDCFGWTAGATMVCMADMVLFNVTGYVKSQVFDNNAGQTDYECWHQPPGNPQIALDDIDDDSVFEAGIAYDVYRNDAGSGTNQIYIGLYELNTISGSLAITMSHNHSYVDTDWFPDALFKFGDFLDGGDVCDDLGWTGWPQVDPQWRNKVTSPMFYDADAGDSEFVIGMAVDQDAGAGLSTQVEGDFQLVIFDSNLNAIENHPEIENIEGAAMSNPFAIDCMEDGNGQDYGMLIHSPNATAGQTSELMICGSITNTYDYNLPGTLETVTFNMEGQEFVVNRTAEATVHAVSMNATNGESEVLTSYGVFELFYSNNIACGNTGQCDMNLSWESPRRNGAYIPVDMDGDGDEDLLAITRTNILVFSDSFSNQQATVSEATFDPCVGDATVRTNSTLTAQVTVSDPESDDVEVNLVCYQGNVNEQYTGWSGFAASGTTFTLQCELNQTVTNGKIYVYTRDDVNNASNSSELIYFTVADNGIGAGEGCTSSIEEEDDAADGISLEDEDNAVTVSVGELTDWTGLSGGLIWLFFMVVGTIYLVFAIGSDSPGVTLGVVGAFNTLMVIMGVFLGFVSTGVVITIGIIGFIIMGVVFMQVFKGGGGGG